MTDLAIWEPHPESRELRVTSLHPGVTREQMSQSVGWEILYADTVAETTPPTTEELQVLRDLHRRTEEAHKGMKS